MENIKSYEAMAKLGLKEDERQAISEKADMLVKSFETIEAIDTDKARPMTTVLGIQNILREDISAKSFAREDLLKTAPEAHDGYFLAPKTLE